MDIIRDGDTVHITTGRDRRTLSVPFLDQLVAFSSDDIYWRVDCCIAPED